MFLCRMTTVLSWPLLATVPSQEMLLFGGDLLLPLTARRAGIPPDLTMANVSDGTLLTWS